MSRGAIDAQIVASGRGWRLTRIEVRREQLLGALVKVGPWRQTRCVESGGFVIGEPASLAVLGRGHTVELPPHTAVLYLPLARRGAVEWVLATAEQAEGQPELAATPPPAERLRVPTVRSAPPRDSGAVGTWSPEWLGLPADVATWASALRIRGTSLTQRTQRLVGEPAKPILAALRASLACELAADYRGRGLDLALDTGYASHAHLSRDLRERFGVPLSRLLGPSVAPELDWLRLVKGAVR